MNYAVEGLPSAEQELANLWNTASDRDAVADSADAIDVRLARDPLGLGESRGGSTRIAFIPPLGVLFDVQKGVHRVIVWDVWLC